MSRNVKVLDLLVTVFFCVDRPHKYWDSPLRCKVSQLFFAHRLEMSIRISLNSSMTSSHYKSSQALDAPNIHDLVSSRFLQETLSITHKTVKRWQKKYGWKAFYINDRLLRFRKSEVQESLGVNLEPLN